MGWWVEAGIGSAMGCVCTRGGSGCFPSTGGEKGLTCSPAPAVVTIRTQAANSGCLICLVLCCLSWIDNGEEEMLSCVLAFM